MVRVKTQLEQNRELVALFLVACRARRYNFIYE